ncbi:hypothetical protein Tco_0200157 [Tanacetum coccineum]
MNQNYYDPNLCYNSNSSGFDQYQPPQYSVTHQPLHIKKKQEEKNVAEEQATKVSSQYWKPPIYYDDDDGDEERVINLNTIPETGSDEENESSVKDLNLTPSESEDLSEDLSDYESECGVPVCDDSSSKNEGLEDIVSIPPGKEINQLDAIPDSKVDFDPKEDILLIKKLLNDDSSPEELNSEIPDAIIKSFSPSPIPVEDSDSLMEEIDIFLAPDDSIPLGIENDDYDSKGYESFHVDFYNVPSSPRPPEKPPDDDVYFDIEPDTGVLTTKVVDNISDNSTRELYVHMPNVLPTLPTLSPVIDTLLPFSSENKDKVFNPGILASNEEKSPHLPSHRGFKAFQIIYFSESPMMIYGEDIPILDVSLFSISILFDQLKYGGSSQAQDSVNKNKRFVGGNPCLSF